MDVLKSQKQSCKSMGGLRDSMRGLKNKPHCHYKIENTLTKEYRHNMWRGFAF